MVHPLVFDLLLLKLSDEINDLVEFLVHFLCAARKEDAQRCCAFKLEKLANGFINEKMQSSKG